MRQGVGMFHLACSAVLGVTVLLLSATASAQKSQSQPPAADSPQRQAEIEVVAKKLCKAEPVIGTRLAVKRKCDTPAQLRQYQAQAREMIENHRQRTPCLMGMEVGEGQAMPC